MKKSATPQKASVKDKGGKAATSSPKNKKKAAATQKGASPAPVAAPPKALPPKRASKPRNRLLSTGINKLCASVAHSKSKRYERKYHTPKPTVAKKRLTKAWYPTEDTKHKLPSSRVQRNSKRITKLRKSITPGTVLIIVAGKYAGKRVVFLKQLKSGLLAVTGPFKVNGVPLRRVNQAYVIGTHTKVDISNVPVVDSLNDAYFAKSKNKKSENFFRQSAEVVVSAKKRKDQKSVDEALLPIIQTIPLLAEYLNSRFSLGNHDLPHAMLF